ncbi:SDR family oxidoreductase [Desulfobotulus sp. H1]|uniref:SDR family oxidoreductase n=1 Tax=Desulfobotulus pelophilus TaxID=2823377 RepID=A0ABT3N9Y8_9BACT|nr:SDR family oxidoreductase [Desulfobotulus pelophilus]MCW7754281.1 SDR family oxidoreductase [Desulfobotulus pelophilus]
MEGKNGSLRFDDQVVLITGAGGGLGRAYAMAYARRGARVVVNDIGATRRGDGHSDGPAASVVEEIRAMGGEAFANTDSVADPVGGESMVAAAVAQYGRLDILVNNAGNLRDVSLARMQPEDWDAILDVHLKGAFCVTAPAFRIMKDQNYGRILFTTSAAGLYGNFGQTHYAAAKMGLVGLMQSLCIEGRKNGIQANVVAPLAASRMTEDLLPPEVLENMDPATVAPLVLWLTSSACTESGSIVNMGLGCLNRVQLVTGRGVRFDATTPLQPEAIARMWGDVLDMKDARPFPDMNAFILGLFS